MDCPTCGLTNPPEAVRCDCGYDFSVGKPADFPGWEISLAWRQKVAALWSISWPAWIAAMILMLVLTSGYPVDYLETNLTVIALGGNLAFFVVQALLTRRLVRKNYRSFRVYVVRQGGAQSRNLSVPEIAMICLWILGPQFAFLLLMWLVASVWLSPQTIKSFSWMSQCLRFLVVGPYAVGLAVRMKYPTFRLQAHGLRYA